MLSIHSQAPTFTLPDQENVSHSLSDYIGKFVLIYFYPEDDTPGCTKEACAFRDAYTELSKKVVVLGISNNSVASHKKFVEKYDLPFTLLADTSKQVINAYEASMGLFTKRVSYLINPQGIIVKTYPSVDPTTHASEILSEVSSM